MFERRGAIMSRLDDVKDAFLALTQGLTVEEKEWVIKKAFPDVLRALVVDRVAEELSKERIRNIKRFKDGESESISIDHTKQKYDIKYDNNTVEIVTDYSIDVDIESDVESGYVGAGGMHFTYDNPEETTIRLTF